MATRSFNPFAEQVVQAVTSNVCPGNCRADCLRQCASLTGLVSFQPPQVHSYTPLRSAPFHRNPGASNSTGFELTRTSPEPQTSTGLSRRLSSPTGTPANSGLTYSSELPSSEALFLMARPRFTTRSRYAKYPVVTSARTSSVAPTPMPTATPVDIPLAGEGLVVPAGEVVVDAEVGPVLLPLVLVVVTSGVVCEENAEVGSVPPAEEEMGPSSSTTTWQNCSNPPSAASKRIPRVASQL